MKNKILSWKTYVSKSHIPKAGRGVFAVKDIKKGELIEVCPAIKISRNDPANVDGGALVQYFFHYGKTQTSKTAIAVVLGHGSLYNHSYNPNATYVKNPAEGTVEFFAIKNIKKDEEITTNYNYGNPNDKKKLRVHTKVPAFKDK